jgi:hypothetical protein
MEKHWIQTLATLVVLFGATTAIFLYTSGWRLTKDGSNPIDFKRTGMISVRSLPEGASVYINEILKTATNDTVSALDPGTYNLRITKNGYVTWEKDVAVFAELVTDITAVLVPQSPRLEPLTNTGARMPAISHSLNKIAYFSKDTTNPGIWITNLTAGGLSLFRSERYVAIEDTFNTIFSEGKNIEWSPNEQELLILDDKDTYYLVNILTKTTQSTTSPETIRTRWETDLLKKRTDFIQKIDMPQEMIPVATSSQSIWSPDDKKFIYTKEKDTPEGRKIEYRVYNMEKPIPVGEKVDSLVFETGTNDEQPAVSWYGDSFHLILVNGNIEEESRGIINLIRIDGTNKTEIYNGIMHSKNVYSTPTGEKLIFSTSFRSNGQTDLYTVGIR